MFYSLKKIAMENCFISRILKKSSCINNTFLIMLTMLLKLFHLYPCDPKWRLNLSLTIQVSMQELNQNRTLNLELWSLYTLLYLHWKHTLTQKIFWQSSFQQYYLWQTTLHFKLRNDLFLATYNSANHLTLRNLTSGSVHSV